MKARPLSTGITPIPWSLWFIHTDVHHKSLWLLYGHTRGEEEKGVHHAVGLSLLHAHVAPTPPQVLLPGVSTCNQTTNQSGTPILIIIPGISLTILLPQFSLTYRLPKPVLLRFLRERSCKISLGKKRVLWQESFAGEKSSDDGKEMRTN